MNWKNLFAGFLYLHLAGSVGAIQPALGSDARTHPFKPQVKPQDFAFGIDIETPQGGPVYTVNLPEDVYREIKREDLGDIRVFNSQSEIVPHSLEHQVFEERQSSTRQPVWIFPIEGAPASAGRGSAIEVKEDASGRVVNVRFSGQQKNKPGQARAYLFDLRKHDQNLKSLEFEWSSTGPNQVISAQIEASDDLKYWRPITSGAVLAKLAYQGETLEQKKIEFPKIRSQFLKFTWQENVPLKLDGVNGDFVSRQKIEATRNWTKVTGLARSQKKDIPQSNPGEELIFNTKAAFPVDSIKVLLPETNMFLRVRLSSSNAEDGPWLDRWSGTVYRVNVDGREIVSAPIQLSSPIADRYWVFKVEGRESNMGGRMPELEMGWVPHRLLFLAQGTGPFRLAYGSAIADRTDFGFVSLMESLKTARGGQPVVPQQAQLAGGQKELGGPARLTPPPEVKPLPWKQWALWAALGLAVLVVAGMAWQLYRDLSAKTP